MDQALHNKIRWRGPRCHPTLSIRQSTTPVENSVTVILSYNGLYKLLSDSVDTISQKTDNTVRNTMKIDNNPSRKHSAIDHSWVLPTRRSRGLSILSLPKHNHALGNGVVIPKIVFDLMEEKDTPAIHPALVNEGPYLESGKFFVEPEVVNEENLVDNYDARSADSTTMTIQGDQPISIINPKTRTQSAVGNWKH